MKTNLLIGNGVNIQHGGYAFSNSAIILRTLKCFKDPTFPKHILTDDPIEAKCYIGYLFLEINRMLDSKYDNYTNSSTERASLDEFKKKYQNKPSLKITDVGFEDYYLIHDLLCHRIEMDNPERYTVREAIKWCFLNSIYDGGNVNSIGQKYSPKFVDWLCGFNQIFTTNYDTNIETASGKTVNHLHGDFITRSAVYSSESFRSQLSDHPCENCTIDEKYSHLYSTALTTYSGNYKQYVMQEGEFANSAVEKMADAYLTNPIVQQDVDSWENDRNKLVSRMRESILLKVENPDLKFDEPYPIKPLRDMEGDLVILGLSPYNDKHLFQIINDSNISKCTFYYFDESEKDIILSLIFSHDVYFEDVRKFWGVTVAKNPTPTKSKKRITFKHVTRSEFHKFAECYRTLSKSIMSDNDVVLQFNRVPFHLRTQICNRIKELQVEREREPNQQFVLNIVDIHIIAEEFNIDPAVVCCVGTDQCRNEFIRLR